MRTRLTRPAALSAVVALGAVIAVSATTNADSGVPASEAAPPPGEPTGPGCAEIPADGPGSLADMGGLAAGNAATSSAVLSTLSGALFTADLVGTLNGAGPFTILAPSNAAFEKIPANVLDSILADNELLTTMLGYHVIEGEALSAAALVAAGSATTLEGNDLTFADVGGTITVNGSTNIVCADISVANGVVHVIDSVLQAPSNDLGGDGSSSVPSSAPNVTAVATPGDGPQGPACASLPTQGAGSLSDMFGLTAAEALASNPLLTQFVAALDTAGLTETLAGAGPFTIFAPSNDAFAAIPAGDLDAVLADAATLTNLLDYHVISGQSLTAADLATVGSEVTEQGGTLSFASEADGSLSIDNGQATVTCSNIAVANGTIHIIGSLLVPPVS